MNDAVAAQKYPAQRGSRSCADYCVTLRLSVRTPSSFLALDTISASKRWTNLGSHTLRRCQSLFRSFNGMSLKNFSPLLGWAFWSSLLFSRCTSFFWWWTSSWIGEWEPWSFQKWFFWSCLCFCRFLFQWPLCWLFWLFMGGFMRTENSRHWSRPDAL